jgi:hypothetical protein
MFRNGQRYDDDVVADSLDRGPNGGLSVTSTFHLLFQDQPALHVFDSFVQRGQFVSSRVHRHDPWVSFVLSRAVFDESLVL